MVKDIKYIIRRVIIGVLIALILGFIGTRQVRALDTVGFNQWNMVYRNQTVGQTWDNTFIYRLGEEQSLLAINVYFPYFEGYYNGTITIQADPAQFPNGSLQLTNQFFKLFLYENGSYSSDYFVGTCDGELTCTFNFRGTSKQLQTNRFSLQLLINNDPFTTTFIFYPAFRVSSSVYVSNDSNSGNNDIINNQNENTQNIINNQNDNTKKEIESQKVCSTEIINQDDITDNNCVLNSSGSLSCNQNNYGVTGFIPIGSYIKSLEYQSSSYANFCFYDDNKQTISCSLIGNAGGNQLLSIPNGAKYFRSSINTSTNKPKFEMEVCKNGNQAITDSITDESAPGIGGFIEGLTGLFPTQTPVTDLLTLPITLLNRYMNSLNGTCSPFDLGELYGSHLIMPCLNIEDRLGSNLWHTIDVFMSFFMVYNIAMLLVSIYNDITDLRDTFSSLYEPQHATYKPRHGGE